MFRDDTYNLSNSDMIEMVYDWAYHIAGKKLLFFYSPLFYDPLDNPSP